MRIFLPLVLLLFLCGQAFALDYHQANQVTIAWDADESDLSGIQYEVFQAAPDKTDPVSLGLTSATEYTVTLTEGRYLLGVAAVRFDAGEEVARSEVAWSDEASPAFGVMYFQAPGKPTGLGVR